MFPTVFEYMFDTVSKHPPTYTVKRPDAALTGTPRAPVKPTRTTREPTFTPHPQPEPLNSTTPDGRSKGIAMSDHNHDLLTNMIERWNAHDNEHLYGLLVHDYREYLNGVLVKNGRADAREADKFLYDTIPDYRAEVDDLYVDEHGAAMRWRFIGTGPNGPFELPVASFYRIAQGRIVECWQYGDSAANAHALGLDT
jgi:ketosteroid isomerase-like protein